VPELSLYVFPDQTVPAGRLADALGLALEPIAVHPFPDGESLVRVSPSRVSALVYCSLDRPNEKLVELMLAASALRDAGAQRLVLVAPYMCYMRQDRAFNEGEAVSQQVVGRFLAGLFDRIISVDPHLHRTHDMSAIFPGCEAEALSATALIAETARGEAGRTPVVVGPDAESRQWIEPIAEILGSVFVIARKQRLGDRRVVMDFGNLEAVRGRPVLLVDDIISSGGTVREAVRHLQQAGAQRIDVVAIHAFADPGAVAKLMRSGVVSLRSTDSVVHPSNAIWLAPLLASALEREAAPS
jgi:ribose-phosphate pyrophosphokinase